MFSFIFHNILNIPFMPKYKLLRNRWQSVLVVASHLQGHRPLFWCVHFACSPSICVSSLLILLLGATVQKHARTWCLQKLIVCESVSRRVAHIYITVCVDAGVALLASLSPAVLEGPLKNLPFMSFSPIHSRPKCTATLAWKRCPSFWAKSKLSRRRTSSPLISSRRRLSPWTCP